MSIVLRDHRSTHSQINTFQSGRAPSTRGLFFYVLKWRPFEAWCLSGKTVPFQSLPSPVLSFLHNLHGKGKAFSVVKVYLAAISCRSCRFGWNDFWGTPPRQSFYEGGVSPSLSEICAPANWAPPHTFQRFCPLWHKLFLVLVWRLCDVHGVP